MYYLKVILPASIARVCRFAVGGGAKIKNHGEFRHQFLAGHIRIFSSSKTKLYQAAQKIRGQQVGWGMGDLLA